MGTVLDDSNVSQPSNFMQSLPLGVNDTFSGMASGDCRACAGICRMTGNHTVLAGWHQSDC